MTPPPVIPEYTLLRPIGRGAYGEVWLARNVMGTWRAVKVIWRRQFESDRPFEREFAGIQRYEPVSRSSGGLVHVLHVGRNDVDGYFYYVMELADDAGTVPGSGLRVPSDEGVARPQLETRNSKLETFIPRTLRSDLKRGGRLPVPDCLRLGLDLVSGLAQLHRHNLVHRDVKPANIIYVHDHAKLADIGLVTADGEGRTFVGTEGYIPPEGPGAPTADLYALGMVLYEASTGLPPDRFPDVPGEWLEASADNDALELHEVILKACEGQRERRYRRAEEMQADLALLQNGESVRHMRALKRRYARLRLGLAVGLTLLVCALVVAGLAGYRARLAAENRLKESSLRQQAQLALARTKAAEQQARQQLYAALLEQARATVRGGELGQRVRTLEAVRRAGAISNTAELRGAALAAMALPDLSLSRPVPGTAGATLAEMDPRFEQVALCREAGPIEILSAADGHRQQVLPASTNLPVYLGWWSHDGRFLAAKRNYPTEDDLGDLEIWNVKKAERLAVIRDVEFLATAFHPKLPRIIFATAGGWIVTRDLELGTEISRFQLSASPKLLIYSPDGSRFAASYERPSGGMVSVNQADHGRELMVRGFSDFVIGLAWHPNGRWISTADFDGGVQLLDSHNGESRLLGRHKAQGATVVFSGDGEYLLSGGWERELICWDVRRMERAFTIALESFKAKFRADGLECATLADDGLQIHGFERPAGRREMVEDLGPLLRQAAFSPDGHWVAAAAKKRVGIWDLSADGSGIVVDQPEQARLYFSASDELFGSRDDGAFDWQVSPAEEPAAPPKLEKKSPPETHGFTSLCLTSSEVVVTDQDGSRTCPLGPAGVAAADRVPTANGLNGVSRDGRWVGIFRPFTPRLHLYRLPGFVEGATLTNRANVLAFEFSPTSGEVAVSSAKGVEIWNPATGQRLRELTNFVGLLYGPDRKTCWLTHDFRNAGLYDLRSLQPLLPLPVGSLPLALSPDGRRLAVSVDGKRLQVWDLAEARERLRELGLDWAD